MDEKFKKAKELLKLISEKLGLLMENKIPDEIPPEKRNMVMNEMFYLNRTIRVGIDEEKKTFDLAEYDQKTREFFIFSLGVIMGAFEGLDLGELAMGFYLLIEG